MWEEYRDEEKWEKQEFVGSKTVKESIKMMKRKILSIGGNHERQRKWKKRKKPKGKNSNRRKKKISQGKRIFRFAKIELACV